MLAIGLASALGQVAYGKSQQKKAEEMRKKNIRPTYEISPEEKENQRITQLRAQQGLPETVKQYYTQGAERGLTTGVDAILKGGGNMNQIGGLYSGYNDALSRLAIADDARNYANVQALIENNRRMTQERDKEFQVNKYGPYADTAQLAAQTAAQGANYINSGINTATSSLMGATQAFGAAKDINDVGGRGGGGGGGVVGGATTATSTPAAKASNGPIGPMPQDELYMPPATPAPSTARQTFQTPGYADDNYFYTPPPMDEGLTWKHLTPQQQADIAGLYQRRGDYYFF